MQSECVYQGCTGVAAVPGDYATIQSAVTALAPIGGTICLHGAVVHGGRHRDRDHEEP